MLSIDGNGCLFKEEGLFVPLKFPPLQKKCNI